MKILIFLLIFSYTKNFYEAAYVIDDENEDKEQETVLKRSVDDEPEDDINELDTSEDDGSSEDDVFNDDDSHEGKHIVEGDPIEIEIAPWQVQIRNASNFTTCGGSIIHDRWVLTAAHCLYRKNIRNYSLLTGNKVRHEGEYQKIKSVFIHEGYSPKNYSNDIALIELDKPLTFSNKQKPIEFLDRPINNKDHVYISGYGLTSTYGRPSAFLLAATTPVKSSEACKKAYSYVNTEKQFCAGNGITDTCSGDSGGPATIDHKLAGITSFGADCATELPGVYTLVKAYVPWIREKTGLPLGPSAEGDEDAKETSFKEPVKREVGNQADAVEKLESGKNIKSREYQIESVEEEEAKNFFGEGGKPPAQDEIVNGLPITINRAAYQVQLQLNGFTGCGGSIIDKRWILTAAHCLYNQTGKFSILTGSSKRDKGERHGVEKVILHENYDPKTFDNDIALIKLQENMRFSKTQNLIKLGTEDPKPGSDVFLSGYGRTSTGGPISDVLQATNTPVKRRLRCNAGYFLSGLSVTDKMFCAGDGKTDTCQGDSGGPAVVDDKLVGIVSFGLKCQSFIAPGVYTLVPAYLSWIKEKTGLRFERLRGRDSDGESDEMEEILELGDEPEYDDVIDYESSEDENEADYYEDESDWSDDDDDNDETLLDMSDEDTNPESSIVNGETSSIKRVPYQVQLQQGGWTSCGGAIINHLWIITAAHCLYGEKRRTYVLVGSMMRDGGIPYKVEKKIIHKNYQPKTNENDIALLKLAQPLAYSDRVKKIRIGIDELPEKGKVLLSGYGKLGTNRPVSDKLKVAVTPLYNRERCKRHYANRGRPIRISERQFCAGNGKTDTCQGDSGGPAVVKGRLYGIVSFGLDCADPYFPGVYVLAPKYRKWIRYHTKLKHV